MRLPDDFEGDTPEALAFLLYEIMRLQKTERDTKESGVPSTQEGVDILSWLSRTGEDLWYQSSIRCEKYYVTDEYQDREDEEIENIIIENRKSPKVLKKRNK